MGVPRLPQQGPLQDERYAPHLRLSGRKFLEPRQNEGNQGASAAYLIDYELRYNQKNGYCQRNGSCLLYTSRITPRRT